MGSKKNMLGRMSSSFSSLCSLQNNLVEMEPQHRKWRRIHGFQLPLHPQQIAGMVTLLFFVLFFYLLVYTNLPKSPGIVCCAIMSVLVPVLVVVYTLATIVDPSHPDVRKMRSNRPVPEFDRNKHAHVIENGRCHLCNVTVTNQRTKHCSLCNKCVDGFDHHCRWLNHCIGQRNYKLFLATVFLASLGVAIVMGCSIAILVQIWTSPLPVTISPGEDNSTPGYFDTSTVPGSDKTAGGEVALQENKTTERRLYAGIQRSPLTGSEGRSGNIPNKDPVVSKAGGSSSKNVALPNPDDQEDGEGNLPESKSPVFMENLGREAKTSIFGFAILLAIITLAMLIHLGAFHVYICFKGLTTYEFLKPPLPREGKEMEDGGAVNGGEGKTDPHGNEMDDAIWTTMTEIDLNAPDFTTTTLPRQQNNKQENEEDKDEAQKAKVNLNNEKNNADALRAKNYNFRKITRARSKESGVLCSRFLWPQKNKVNPRMDKENTKVVMQTSKETTASHNEQEPSTNDDKPAPNPIV